jgi:hypothetical protein
VSKYLISFKQNFGNRAGPSTERTIKVEADTKAAAMAHLVENYHHPYAIRIFKMGKTESLTKYPKVSE